MTAVREWLDFLYSHPDLAGTWLSACWRTSSGRLASTHVPVERLDEAATVLARHAATTDVWVGCCPLAARPASGRGTSDDVAAVVGCWADVDVAGPGHKPNPDALPLPPDRGAAWALLDALPLDPSAVLDSGGGLQVWWVLDRPLRVDDTNRGAARMLVERWATTCVEVGRRFGWHVDSTGDLARILRPAGTWNRKLVDNPRPVELVHVSDVRYSPAELLAAYVAPPAPPRPKLAPARPVHRMAGSSPADVFNRYTTWAQVLEPFGWTLVGTDREGRELWRRPGDPETPYSLKAGPHAATVWSGNAGLDIGPRPPGEKWTRFRLWAHLAHGGDLSAAARAILTAAREVRHAG